MRLFDHPILEALTMSPWWAIPLTYLPLSAWYLYKTTLTGVELCVAWLLGVMLWTVVEYFVHRLVFHSEESPLFPSHPKLMVLHFLVHGIHHAFP